MSVIVEQRRRCLRLTTPTHSFFLERSHSLSQSHRRVRAITQEGQIQVKPQLLMDIDFHPEISSKNYEFKLVFGSERKTTGSYYTPPQLVGQEKRVNFSRTIDGTRCS